MGNSILEIHGDLVVIEWWWSQQNGDVQQEKLWDMAIEAWNIVKTWMVYISIRHSES